jgi:hypothetical protein
MAIAWGMIPKNREQMNPAKPRSSDMRVRVTTTQMR